MRDKYFVLAYRARGAFCRAYARNALPHVAPEHANVTAQWTPQQSISIGRVPYHVAQLMKVESAVVVCMYIHTWN
jgi:hypothetical protein